MHSSVMNVRCRRRRMQSERSLAVIITGHAGYVNSQNPHCIGYFWVVIGYFSFNLIRTSRTNKEQIAIHQ
jgi:hypothetical protein